MAGNAWLAHGGQPQVPRMVIQSVIIVVIEAILTPLLEGQYDADADDADGGGLRRSAGGGTAAETCCKSPFNFPFGRLPSMVQTTR